MASIASQLTALRLISTGKPSISAALDAIAAHIEQLEADRVRILAAERDSRRSFENARDEQARATQQLKDVLRSIVDSVTEQPYHGADASRLLVDADVIDEARVLLDGDSAPAEEK